MNSSPGIDVVNPEAIFPPCFRDAACAHFQCPTGEYAARVLRHCLHRHALLLLWGPPRPHGWFRHDLELLEHLAPVTNLVELRREVNNHHYARRRAGSSLLDLFRLRLSGARLLRLGSRLLKSAEPSRFNPLT